MSDQPTPHDRDGSAAGRGEEFVQLFTRHQRRLYLYVLSLIGDPVEAEEVLQETNVVIWSKFDQFEKGTNFHAWACRIATYQVLKHRERRQRDKLYFSDDFIQTIAAEGRFDSDQSDLRRVALVECLKKLRERDRELIRQRYAPGETGKGIAERLGRPANSVYQSLGRIRRTLLECITRRLAAAEAGR
ncbi:MAG: sigma-70 family RNA polymerase sigma factor [Planctomycetaceae bacterium]